MNELSRINPTNKRALNLRKKSKNTPILNGIVHFKQKYETVQLSYGLYQCLVSYVAAIFNAIFIDPGVM